MGDFSRVHGVNGPRGTGRLRECAGPVRRAPQGARAAPQAPQAGAHCGPPGHCGSVPRQRRAGTRRPRPDPRAALARRKHRGPSGARLHRGAAARQDEAEQGARAGGPRAEAAQGSHRPRLPPADRVGADVRRRAQHAHPCHRVQGIRNVHPHPRGPSGRGRHTPRQWPRALLAREPEARADVRGCAARRRSCRRRATRGCPARSPGRTGGTRRHLAAGRARRAHGRSRAQGDVHALHENAGERGRDTQRRGHRVPARYARFDPPAARRLPGLRAILRKARDRQVQQGAAPGRRDAGGGARPRRAHRKGEHL